MLQAYVDEAGRLVALEEFEPNREKWHFAQVLPSIPERYRCCGCAHPFVAHPGAMVQCPQCGHLYVQVEWRRRSTARRSRRRCFTNPAQTDWVMRCTPRKVLRTAEQEPVVLPPAKRAA